MEKKKSRKAIEIKKNIKLRRKTVFKKKKKTLFQSNDVNRFERKAKQSLFESRKRIKNFIGDLNRSRNLSRFNFNDDDKEEYHPLAKESGFLKKESGFAKKESFVIK